MEKRFPDLMVRGDRLLFALDALGFVYHTEAKHTGCLVNNMFSLASIRATMRDVGDSNVFPNVKHIYVGAHRGKKSLGLSVVYWGLLVGAHQIQRAKFNWNRITEQFLDQWLERASDAEQAGLYCWMKRIASGDIEETDFWPDPNG